jgi:hypothetical protein
MLIKVISPFHQRLNLHEHVPSALLARFDYPALELLQLRLARVNDAVGRGQRDERRYAQLRKLFYQEVRPIPLGQGRGNLQGEAQFPLGGFSWRHLDPDPPAFNFGNPGRVFMSIAVKQANCVACVEPTDRGKMVSFRPFQVQGARLQRQVDVKSFGHPCYNTAAARSGRGPHRVGPQGPPLPKRISLARSPLMSTRKNPAPAEPPRHLATKQMLDELDALMERMLALPVQQPEDTPASPTQEREPMAVSASLSVVEPPPEVDSALEEENQPLPWVEQLVAKVQAETETLTFEPLPSPPAEKNVPISQPVPAYDLPVIEEPPRPPVRNIASPQPQPIDSFPETSPGNDVLPALQELKPAKPILRGPNRFTLWKREIWKGLIWINQAFDHGSYRLGNFGFWLRSPKGRLVLGWTGIALIAVGLLWLLMF